MKILSQESILQELVSQSGVKGKGQQQGLKKSFQKKCAKHVNLIQYHRLRQDRFAISQQKVLQMEKQSIIKTKEYLALRQSKAHLNKNHSMIERSKRVEEDLTRWEKIVEKNKREEKRRIQDSVKLIQEWNDKISETSPNQHFKVNSINKIISKKSAEKSMREKSQGEEPNIPEISNPQETKIIEARYNREMRLKNSRKSLRVSTQSLHQRKNRMDQDALQKSLVKTGQKQQRINEARFIKHHLMQRKNKLKHQREDVMKQMRLKHLVEIKEDQEARSRQIVKKLRNQRAKTNKGGSSLPLISGHKATEGLLMRGPGEEWRTKSPKPNEGNYPKAEDMINTPKHPVSSRTLQHNYDKLVLDKLRNVAIMVRRGRKV